MNGLPYYKRYPRDFIEGTIGLSFELKATYSIILDLIYMQGGNLPDDPRYISGLLGVSVRKWNSLRSQLVDAGKIQITGEFLTNYRAVTELESLSKYQDKQAENRSRPNKNKDLQSPKQSPKHHHTEPDTDIEDTNVSLSLVPTDDGPDEISQAIDLFKDAAKESGWPVPRVLTKARRSALSARLKECGGIDGWRVALEKAQASRHCCGGNSRGWVLNFDFITTQSSFAKLMEGNYDNRTDNGQGNGPQRQARPASPNAGVDQISFAARGRRTPTTDCF